MIQFENAIKRFGNLILDELKEANIKTWIAGGSVRDYFMDVKIMTDFDLFFPDETEYEKAKEYFMSKNAEVLWESDNGMKVKYNGKIYDLIKKYFENPLATIDAFDFTVSMFAVDNEKVYYGESSFIDLAKKQLMINKITYPASTLSRAFRYYKKGFSMCKTEMKKLVEAIQEMPKEELENKNENIDDPISGEGVVGKFFIGID